MKSRKSGSAVILLFLVQILEKQWLAEFIKVLKSK